MKKILLFNDLPGYGKVALNAMIPILSHFGYDLSTLPSALVSNTLDYGLFEILDTTEYVKKSLKVWDELGFVFDAVTIGFLVNDKQVDLIHEYIATRKTRPFVMLDPIMGDDGVLYHGVSEDAIIRMREMLELSDLTVPNITEAQFISGLYIGKKILTQSEVCEILDKLHELGAREVVITSIETKEGFGVALSDDQGREFIPYEPVPIMITGTGDIFSSFLIGKLLQDCTLKESTTFSMDATKKLISWNAEFADVRKGIPLEKDLHKILF